MSDTTNITPPRVNFLDARTGKVSREWYMFFLSLFKLTGSGQSTITLDDLQIVPADNGDAYSEAITALETWAQTLPVTSAHVAPVDWLEPSLCIPSAANDVSPVPIPVDGASGTFTTADAKTVTVLHGLIVSII